MPARVTPETIIEYVLVRLLADVGAHELPSRGRRGQALQAADNVVGDVIEVGLAAIQKIWPRFSEEVLHGIGDKPGRDYGQGETQNTSMQLP